MRSSPCEQSSAQKQNPAPFNSYSKPTKYVEYRKVFKRKIFELSQSPIYPLIQTDKYMHIQQELYPNPQFSAFCKYYSIICTIIK